MRRWLGAAVLGIAACSSGAEAPMPEVEPGAGAPTELSASLNVSVEGDSVRLEFHVTNVTNGPIVLEFGSTQRYDFAVSHTDGTVVWRWSAARSFAQVLGEERLEPGASRRYDAVWPVSGHEGDQVASAWLVSFNYPVELRTVFRLPGD